MKDLTFLGRGSCFNVNEGNTAAYIIIEDTFILFDCGPSIFKIIMNNNLLDNIKNVDICITHTHTDHVGSLGDFIFYCYYIRKIIPNIIYNEYNGDEILKFLLNVGITNQTTVCSSDNNAIKYNTAANRYCIKNNMPILLLLREYYTYKSQNYSIYIIPVDHTPALKCVSYVIADDEDSIFFSGDCTKINFTNTLINGCKKFYIDASFMDYDNNPHYNLKDLYNDCVDYDIDTANVYIMHIDSKNTIYHAKKMGFNVVEIGGGLI